MIYMLLGLLCALVIGVASIVVFSAISDSARPESAPSQAADKGDNGADRNSDKSREKRSQQIIQTANAPRSTAKSAPVQPMAPIPVPKKASVKEKKDDKPVEKENVEKITKTIAVPASVKSR